MEAERDGNFVPTLLAVSSVDGVTPVTVYADPVTHRLLTDLTGGGSGTVTSVSVVTANGFAGTVATATSTPAITLTTSVTGILKGNGTAISAVTIGSGLSYDGTTLSATGGGTGDVVGPASATDNALARFDTTTGKLLQDGTITASDVAAGVVTLATIGNNDLKLQTGNATTGSITIEDGANTNIVLSPNGSGDVKVIPSAANGNFQVRDSTDASHFTVTPVTNSTFVQIYEAATGSYIEMQAKAASTYLSITDSDVGTFGPYLELYHNSATPAANDIVGSIYFTGEDSGGGSTNYAFLKGVILDTTAASEDGKLVLSVSVAGAETDKIELTGASLYPTTNDALALGDTTHQYSDLFLAEGAVINFDNGDFTIQQIGNSLRLEGGNVVLGDTIAPITSDTAALGTATLQFSDLFLAEGGVINWDNGDATLTQVGDVLTLAGADLKVTTPGNVSTSVLTTDGTQTLTNKTLTSPAVTTGTYTGAQTLAEGASIALDPSLSADGTWSGITITGTAGYTQAFGDLVYLDPTDSRWEATDANAASGADGDARGLLAMVVVAGTDGASCTLLLQGVIRADANFPTFTVNNPIYVSETAGDVTQTQPTTTDVVIRPIGAALTADSMYFDGGSMFWITHT